MTGGQIHKHREIFFSEFPPEQVPGAAKALSGLEQVTVELLQEKRAIGIDYDLTEHTLQEIEEYLAGQGFRLNDTLLGKLARALVHYAEETELHNLEAPEKERKQLQQEAYVSEWEHHPHGDSDDTPAEWREYK